jgi:hypothetical protein
MNVAETTVEISTDAKILDPYLHPAITSLRDAYLAECIGHGR